METTLWPDAVRVESGPIRVRSAKGLKPPQRKTVDQPPREFHQVGGGWSCVVLLGGEQNLTALSRTDELHGVVDLVKRHSVGYQWL